MTGVKASWERDGMKEGSRVRHWGRPGAWVASLHREHGSNVWRLLWQGEGVLTQHLHAYGEHATHVCPFQCAEQAVA